MCPTDGPVLGLLWIVAVGLTRAWFAVAPPGATNRRRRRCCRRRAVRQLQALLFLVAFCPSYAAPPMPQAGARDAHCQNVPVPGLQNDVEVSAHQELVVDNLADSFRSKHHLVDDLQFNGPQKRPRSLYCVPTSMGRFVDRVRSKRHQKRNRRQKRKCVRKSKKHGSQPRRLKNPGRLAGAVALVDSLEDERIMEIPGDGWRLFHAIARCRNGPESKRTPGVRCA